MNIKWGDIRLVLVGILLLWNAVCDYKKREISLPSLGTFLFLAALLLVIDPQEIFSTILGVFVGVFLLVCGILSRGRLGMGDGLLLCVTGFYLGFWNNFELLFTGLLICSGVSAFLLISKRIKRTQQLPFVPFLFSAFLLLLFGGELCL